MLRLSNADKESIKKNTRKKLMAAATAEFADKGFSGANINQISIAAGYATGTVYDYFPSKRALMLALIDEIGANHSAFIVEKVIAESSLTERVMVFFNAGFCFVEEFPEQVQVAISAVHGFDPELKKRIFQAHQPLFNMLLDNIIALGISNGDFKRANVDTSAVMLMSIYLGSSSLYNPNGGTWLDAEKAFVMDGLRMQKCATESET